jgi:hypothetical protein
MSKLPTAPYDQSRYIGTVCKITPVSVEVNLPKASAHSGSHFAGFDVAAGQVGEFVVIEGEEHALLSRIVEVRLPERDRLSVEPMVTTTSVPNPIGIAQLLTAIDLQTGQAIKGIPIYPRIGQHVFSAHPLIVKQAVEADIIHGERKVKLAVFPHAKNTSLSISPAQLFGRHCAVLGATGGGKSWTLAKLVEEVGRLGGKTILLDATGEFHTQADAVEHTYLGGEPVDQNDNRRFLCFPYWHLTESDLFALFRPSAGAQAPKLKEALRSLKIANIVQGLAVNGLVKKAGQPRAQFEQAIGQNLRAINVVGAKFNINLLSQQIAEECVWPTAHGVQAATHWGGPLANDLAYCTTLVTRIESDINSSHTACIFNPGALDTVPVAIDEFLNAPDKRILRISLEHLPFEHSTREIVVNAVGRYLLRLARSYKFRENPLVVMLDEAHQFLDKSVGEEGMKVTLDAFGLIAKEGRKYGLTCILATQRPRDVPEDVLSQMGMFIVHRLINERDRIVVEKACGNLDSSAASFLPTLGQGEAIIVGVESSMPLPVLIKRPQFEPDSRSPNYEQHWGKAPA